MDNVVASQGGSYLRRTVVYSHKMENLGRKYAQGRGAQALSRIIRALLLPTTVMDLDMRNAMVSPVAAILPRLGLGGHWPADMLSAWFDYARNPDAVRAKLRTKSSSSRQVHVDTGSPWRVPDDDERCCLRFMVGQTILGCPLLSMASCVTVARGARSYACDGQGLAREHNLCLLVAYLRRPHTGSH